MITEIALLYALLLVAMTVLGRYSRPDWPRLIFWLVLPSVAPVATWLGWLAVYGGRAEPRLAVSLGLAYAVPAWLFGILLCIAADFLVRKVHSR